MSPLKYVKGSKELQAGWPSPERLWTYLLEAVTGHMKNRQITGMGSARTNHACPPCLPSVLQWQTVNEGRAVLITKMFNSAGPSTDRWERPLATSCHRNFVPLTTSLRAQQCSQLSTYHALCTFVSAVWLKGYVRSYTEGQDQIKRQLQRLQQRQSQSDKRKAKPCGGGGELILIGNPCHWRFW